MYIYTISTNLLSTWTKFVISESYKSYDLLSEMKEINRLVTGDWGVSEAAAGAETAVSLVQVSAVRWIKYTPAPHCTVPAACLAVSSDVRCCFR